MFLPQECIKLFKENERRRKRKKEEKKERERQSLNKSLAKKVFLQPNSDWW